MIKEIDVLKIIIIQQSSYDVISYFRIYFQCELTLIPPAPSVSRAVTPSHKEIKRSRGHPGASGFGATSPIIAIPPARIARYRSACWLFIFPFLPSFFIIFSEKNAFRKKMQWISLLSRALYKVFLSSLSIIAGAIAWLRHEKRWSKRRFKLPSRNNSSFEGQLSHNAVLYISFECVNGHVEFKTKNWRFGERGGNGG